MMKDDALWALEDAVLEEPSDLMTLPEFRQRVDREARDEDLGMRALAERPEALSKLTSWRR